MLVLVEPAWQGLWAREPGVEELSLEAWVARVARFRGLGESQGLSLFQRAESVRQLLGVRGLWSVFPLLRRRRRVPGFFVTWAQVLQQWRLTFAHEEEQRVCWERLEQACGSRPMRWEGLALARANASFWQGLGREDCADLLKRWAEEGPGAIPEALRPAHWVEGPSTSFLQMVSEGLGWRDLPTGFPKQAPGRERVAEKRFLSFSSRADALQVFLATGGTTLSDQWIAPSEDLAFRLAKRLQGASGGTPLPAFLEPLQKAGVLRRWTREEVLSLSLPDEIKKHLSEKTERNARGEFGGEWHAFLKLAWECAWERPPIPGWGQLGPVRKPPASVERLFVLGAPLVSSEGSEGLLPWEWEVLSRDFCVPSPKSYATLSQAFWQAVEEHYSEITWVEAQGAGFSSLPGAPARPKWEHFQGLPPSEEEQSEASLRLYARCPFQWLMRTRFHLSGYEDRPKEVAWPSPPEVPRPVSPIEKALQNEAFRAEVEARLLAGEVSPRPFSSGVCWTCPVQALCPYPRGAKREAGEEE